MPTDRAPKPAPKPLQLKYQPPTLVERDKLANEALTARYDALNQLLTEVEQRLKALKPLHSVWIEYDHDNDGGGMPVWEVLGLCKSQGSWRLCHAHDNALNDRGPMDAKPIVECPVHVRVQAAKVVRKLHAEIIKSKEDYVPQVDEAIKELTNLCGEM